MKNDRKSSFFSNLCFIFLLCFSKRKCRGNKGIILIYSLLLSTRSQEEEEEVVEAVVVAVEQKEEEEDEDEVDEVLVVSEISP